MSIFERATRIKLRFPSTIGELTSEQLWDLPLTVRGAQPDLDKIARYVNSELKSIDEGSFVALTPDPRRADLELKLDILKHIIAAKIADADAAKTAASNAARRRKLLDVLAAKEDAELSGLTREQIEAEIAKIGA